MKPRAAGRWAALCIAAGCVLVAITIARTTMTQDEPAFYSYGARILTGVFDRRLPNDDSKLPVAALQAMPGAVAAHFPIRARIESALQLALGVPDAWYVNRNIAIYAGRFVTLGFYIALCAVVFVWGREIYGARGAVAATALTAFLPTVLGHAGLLTADVPATCLFVAAVYALARCFLDPSPQAALLVGLALGASQLVKYTAIDLLPIAALMIAARLLTAEPTESRGRVLQSCMVSLVAATAITLVVIDLGFLGRRLGVRLNDLPCESQTCQSTRAIMGSVWLPLPYEYLNGLDLVCLHDEQSIGMGSVYLRGALSRAGFPSYYLTATLLKTPLSFLLLALLRPWRRERRYIDAVLVIPVVCLFVHLSFFTHAQLGLRFFLPAFPFIALLAAANWDARRSPRMRLLADSVLGLYVLTVTAACPHYLAYFNALIGPQRNAYLYLADSNVDWGQDRFALWAWERAHANAPYALAPEVPTAGVVIVRINDFVGIDDPERYRWLRERATPTAVIGDSYLVFDVPESRGGK